MNRKIIFSIVVALLIIVLALFAWYWFSPGPEGPIKETLRNVLPFGAGDEGPSSTAAGEDRPDFSSFDLPEGERPPTTRLFRLSSTPVAGFIALEKNGSTSIRYVERATGHIIDVDPKTLGRTKITNNTLPKIYEAHFRPDGNAVLLRSLRDDSDLVENLLLALTPSAMASELYRVSATPLRGEITEVAAGRGNTLFYALRDSSAIVSSNWSGGASRTLLTSPFKSWRLAPLGTNLVVYTKASAGVPGYAYTLNASGGTLNKILGPFDSLIVMPNFQGTRIAYSYLEDGRLKLFAQTLAGGKTVELSPATLAEKCVWSVEEVNLLYCAAPTEVGPNEPDSWYRGETHFIDRLWRFDTDAEVVELLLEPQKTFGLDLDIYIPRLSPREEYLVFIQRGDLSLWAFKLE